MLVPVEKFRNDSFYFLIFLISLSLDTFENVWCINEVLVIDFFSPFLEEKKHKYVKSRSLLYSESSQGVSFS